MSERELKEYKKMLMGAALTVLLSIASAWGAMSARLYEVEAKVRLVEVQVQENKETLTQYRDMDKSINLINQSLIRIEGKLDLKQDRFEK